MRLRRGSAFIASVAALAAALSLVGAASAAPTNSSAPLAPSAAAAAVDPDMGKPPANATMTSGNYFSYPNRTFAAKVAIRNRVLNTVNSTWGRYVTTPDNPDTPLVDETEYARGEIKMATWSFSDTTMKNALAAARDRGAKVTVIAASSINNDGKHTAWPALRRELNQAGDTTGSSAVECSGACRGRGGTAHSKYFLFNDVGSRHRKNIVMQTSMNLTHFAYQGQWNQATVMWNEGVYDSFSRVFELSRRKENSSVRSYTNGSVTSIFWPKASRSNDVILRALNNTRCKGATAGGINKRTRVRLMNYAIYQDRGTAIAKRLRSLWNYGCNVAIIYSVSSRPVLSILRSRSGRGPIPMRQSVIKNRRGQITKYNHSKWLAISGVYAGRGRGAYTVLPGSANLANLSYSSDEQTQQIFSSAWTRPYYSTFSSTWRQKSSRAPSYGRVGSGARALNSIPEQPTWGEGQYKYLTPEGG